LEIPSSKGLGFRVPHAKQLACLLLLGISNLQKTLDKAKTQQLAKLVAELLSNLHMVIKLELDCKLKAIQRDRERLRERERRRRRRRRRCSFQMALTRRCLSPPRVEAERIPA
jgi:hypothetical protein